MDVNIVADLQARLAERDHVIHQLLQRLDAIELKTDSAKAPAKKTDNSARPTQSKNKKKESSKKKTKETAVTAPKPTLQKSPAVGSDKKTPTKQRARSATPLSAAKKSPLQMVKQDHPAGFEHTKVSFQI